MRFKCSSNYSSHPVSFISTKTLKKKTSKSSHDNSVKAAQIMQVLWLKVGPSCCSDRGEGETRQLAGRPTCNSRPFAAQERLCSIKNNIYYIFCCQFARWLLFSVQLSAESMAVKRIGAVNCNDRAENLRGDRESVTVWCNLTQSSICRIVWVAINHI